MRPQFGPRKVYLIEADYLSEIGQNALLKTLEEAAPGTYFFLTVVRPEDLLATIRSRSMVLRLGPATAAELSSVLTAHGHPDQELQQAAIADARGLPGLALANYRALERGAAGEDEDDAGGTEGERIEQLCRELWHMLRTRRLAVALTDGLALLQSRRDASQAILDGLSRLVLEELGGAGDETRRHLINIEDTLRDLRRGFYYNIHFDTAMTHLLVTLFEELNHA